jgi:hypothetical protein
VPERLEPVELTVVDTNTAEWQGFRVDYLGVALPHIPLVDDPGTGMMVAKMTYPAGHTTPWHTHPCAHGIYVLAGTLNTHQGVDPSTGGLTRLPAPTHPRLIGRRLPKQLPVEGWVGHSTNPDQQHHKTPRDRPCRRVSGGHRRFGYTDPGARQLPGSLDGSAKDVDQLVAAVVVAAGVAGVALRVALRSVPTA